jgi:hypothetical protein
MIAELVALVDALGARGNAPFDQVERSALERARPTMEPLTVGSDEHTTTARGSGEVVVPKILPRGRRA